MLFGQDASDPVDLGVLVEGPRMICQWAAWTRAGSESDGTGLPLTILRVARAVTNPPSADSPIITTAPPPTMRRSTVEELSPISRQPKNTTQRTTVRTAMTRAILNPYCSGLFWE